MIMTVTKDTMLSLSERRYSVRSFTEQAVPDDLLNYVLEVARLAPSAVNFQPWSFIVVRDAALLERLAAVYSREWFRSAPACIVVCGHHQESWHRRSDGKDHCDIDVAIATEHICLAATEVGLGTCWVCNFDAGACREVLGLPDEVEPIVLLPIGYPADAEISEKKRKALEDIVIWR